MITYIYILAALLFSVGASVLNTASLTLSIPMTNSKFQDVDLVLEIARCRAACLDEFSHVLRTEAHCQKESDCLMCWDACEMLHSNFHIWGPMCSVEDICFPGCQKACNSVDLSFKNAHNNEPNLLVQRSKFHFTVRSVYDPQTDRVALEWSNDVEEHGGGAVLYVIFLRDRMIDSKRWYKLTQTTSHVVHVKRGLLGRETDIRLVATNVSGSVTDVVTSYLESLVATPSVVASGEHLVSGYFWRPQLKSMVKSQTSAGIVATITWPLAMMIKKYEVSWNVIDDAMEITGHLYTVSNVAVLTLWPDSLYSIQIKCYNDKGIQAAHSEPLVIDTRASHSAVSVSATKMCSEGNRILYLIMGTTTFILLTFLGLPCIFFLYRYKKSFSGDSSFATNLQFAQSCREHQATSKTMLLQECALYPEIKVQD